MDLNFDPVFFWRCKDHKENSIAIDSWRILWQLKKQVLEKISSIKFFCDKASLIEILLLILNSQNDNEGPHPKVRLDIGI